MHLLASLNDGLSYIDSFLQLIRFMFCFQDGENDHFTNWPSQSIVFIGIIDPGETL